jgi:PAS domain S-box-containing protein
LVFIMKNRGTEDRQHISARSFESNAGAKMIDSSAEIHVLQALLENAGVQVAYLDRNFNFILVNSAYARGSGHSVDELLGKNHFSLFPNEENQRIFEKVRDTGELVRYVDRPFEFVDQPERGITYWTWTLTPVKDEHRNVQGLLLSLIDVTERKKAELALKSANERMKYLLTSTSAVIYTAKVTGDYAATFISENVIQMTGYSSQEFLSDADFWIKHVHPEDRSLLSSEIEKLFKLGQHVYEYRFCVRSGSSIWMRDEMRLVRDEQGKPREIVGLWKDITDQKKVEEALRYSKEQYALAQRAANIGSWDWDLETGNIHWSETLESIYGFEHGGFGGTFEGVMERIHPDDRRFVRAAVDECIKTHEAYEHEHRVLWPNGSVHWVLASGDVMVDESGKAVRMLGVAMDITERKYAEERKLNEEKSRAVLNGLKEIVELLDSISSAVVLATRYGVTKYLNKRARDFLFLEEGQKIVGDFSVDLIAEKHITNEIVFSKKAERSFLVSRQEYQDMFLFLFQPLKDELKKKRMLRAKIAPYIFDDIIGLDGVKRLAQDLAVQDVNILILGESGTGKELLASAIHNASARAGKAFMPINCGAIPVTLFESELFGYKKGAFTDARNDRIGKIEFASGGTLFFDEIGDLPLYIQSKLLRVIEDKTIVPLGSNVRKKVDVRFIFATHRDLAQMVKKGRFREDLYYRINAPVIKIPPLRDRKKEIEKLVENALIKLEMNHHRFTTGISFEALSRLLAYDYPGNVRELEGILKNAYLACRHEQIEVDDLKLGRTYEVPVEERVKAYRARLVYGAYLAHGSDIELTGRALGLSSRQIYRYLKKHRQRTDL